MEFPAEFLSQIESLLKNDKNALLESLKQDVPVSIRLNPAKINKKINLEPVKWCDTGYYPEERPLYTFDPLFHAGCYYPQEASSMFLEQAFKQHLKGDVRMLDLCAAPGGKSTHILSLITENSLLVSNEVIRSRANILSENITKSGYPNVLVSNNDPSDIGKINSFFDAVLIDAPCSGEGMFRKDTNAIDEWSPANVRLCRDRQRRIVADVWDSLKTEGILIYSTCTYNTEENEENVEWICSELGAEPLPLDIPKEWNVTGALRGNLPVYRFLPHKTKGEGFFIAVLRKRGEFKDENKPRVKKNSKEKLSKVPEQYRSFVKNDELFTFCKEGNVWNIVPKSIENDFQFLRSFLKTISYGVNLGEEKGKKFVPSHSLALSNIIDKEAFVVCDLDWETAIAYLQKNAITLNGAFEKGYILLAYKNVPIGFVKNIGNRANNLYPQEWRIRSTNVPRNFAPFL